MSSRIVRWTATAALALLPSTAAAQIEITPFVASFFPATSLATGSNGFLTFNDFEFNQMNSFAFGGRITYPINTGFKLEGEFTYATSGVEYIEDNAFGSGIDGGLNQDGNMMFASIRALFSPRRSNLYFLAGPAFISRGGDAWDGASSDDLKDWGGVAGIGINANVTPKFRINLTAEAYLYSADPVGTGSEFQADILVSVGVPIKLGGN
ncbi:MAG: porin family protein [Gemmatimonadota bacterium]|nr:porin family protein [Gemmatimonadota bacterium]